MCSAPFAQNDEILCTSVAFIGEDRARSLVSSTKAVCRLMQVGSGIALRSRSIILGSVRSIQKHLDKVLRAHHTYLEQDEQRLTGAFDVVHLRKLLLTSDVY
jgi:hypothetical protein